MDQRKGSSHQGESCGVAGQSGICRESDGGAAAIRSHCLSKEPQPSQSDAMSIWRHLEGVQIKALGSAVYIRYKDHVLFKNIWQPLEEAMERETIGWLSKENSEIVLVEHDRTIQDTQLPSGQSRTRNEQSKGKTL